ncbi:HNH endonuclease family protein [Aeromicrobium sp. 179-A 4D2 NHS]|uniref:HNH endonuclease family protein n=1 Tax=Aeromicrobium sp. 179-A 4D2 NHS TaxID=3142375 RepID=UPI00399F9959
MFGFIFRSIVAVCSLSVLWGYANLTGITDEINKNTDLTIPSSFTIPGMDKVITPETFGYQPPAQRRAVEALIAGGANVQTAKDVKALYDKGAKAGLSTDEIKRAIAEGRKNAPKTPAPKTTKPKPGTTDKKVYVAALADAKKLTVKGRAPKTGYKRELFGSAWTDNNTAKWGKNGCDTRNDILKRDLTKVTYKDAKKCAVATGTLADKYTGKTIHFVRGPKSSAVQIDHIIPLSDAWQKGAQSWDTTKRTKFANDPINLMASDGPTNGAKGDKDAATWLPPNKGFRCEYIAKQVTVKKTYGVWVTKAEQDAMVKILNGCAK